MRLAGKVIAVTGSLTGIGRAIAWRCVAEGARVLIHGLPSDHKLGVKLLAELGEDHAALFLGDLNDEITASLLVTRATDAFGKLDGLVNNAAMIGSGSIRDTDAELFMRMLWVNTIAPFLLIQAALPELRDTRGCVLNIGSVNAYCGEPNLLPYSASKGALMTMTRNLGDTLFREDGVRVNQINPGWVLTEAEAARKREQGMGDGWEGALPKTTAPAGRILRPEEIAAAAIYWLSDECGPVSGQVCDLEQYPFIGRNPPKN